MVNDEIKLEDEATSDMSDGELTSDDLGGNFLKNPSVGESVIFTIRSIHENRENLDPVNPKTGKKMKKSLSGVDYNIKINTTAGKTFTTGSWEVWGKLKAIWKQLTPPDAKGFTMANQEVLIKHVRDGTLPDNKVGDNYVVAVKRNGKFYSLPKNSDQWTEVSA